MPVYPLYLDLKALLLRRPPGAVLSRVSSIEGTGDLKDSPKAGNLGIAPSVSSGTGRKNLPSTSSELDSILRNQYSIPAPFCQPLPVRLPYFAISEKKTAGDRGKNRTKDEKFSGLPFTFRWFCGIINSMHRFLAGVGNVSPSARTEWRALP